MEPATIHDRRKRILVVEDEAKIAAVLKLGLEASGYEVHAEDCGRTGLCWALEHQPDLVILDVKLPDISGYDVCRELRKLHHSWTLPIMMVTAMDQPIDQLRGFGYGADAYLTKPFEIPEVVDTVALLLGPPATAAS